MDKRLSHGVRVRGVVALILNTIHHTCYDDIRSATHGQRLKLSSPCLRGSFPFDRILFLPVWRDLARDLLFFSLPVLIIQKLWIFWSFFSFSP
jgi:hypothetical protein